MMLLPAAKFYTFNRLANDTGHFAAASCPLSHTLANCLQNSKFAALYATV